jgi:hypothetical protein
MSKILKMQCFSRYVYMCKSINTFIHTNHVAFSLSYKNVYIILIKFAYDSKLEEMAHVLVDKQTPKRILCLVLKIVKMDGIIHRKCWELLNYDCGTPTLNYTWKLKWIILVQCYEIYIFLFLSLNSLVQLVIAKYCSKHLCIVFYSIEGGLN